MKSKRFLELRKKVEADARVGENRSRALHYQSPNHYLNSTQVTVLVRQRHVIAKSIFPRISRSRRNSNEAFGRALNAKYTGTCDIFVRCNISYLRNIRQSESLCTGAFGNAFRCGNKAADSPIPSAFFGFSNQVSDFWFARSERE